MSLYDRHPKAIFKSQDPKFQMHQTSIDIMQNDDNTSDENMAARAYRNGSPPEYVEEQHTIIPFGKELQIDTTLNTALRQQRKQLDDSISDLQDFANNTGTSYNTSNTNNSCNKIKEPVNRQMSVTPPPFGSPLNEAVTPGLLRRGSHQITMTSTHYNHGSDVTLRHSVDEDPLDRLRRQEKRKQVSCYRNNISIIWISFGRTSSVTRENGTR